MNRRSSYSSANSQSINGKQDKATLSGWLYKWTNYIKGYRQRWFVLDDYNGTLRYYRNHTEMGHSCRGSINLPEARIHTENSCNFIVSGSTQTFHLKANNEVERQKWVTELELTRHKAIKAADSDEDEELMLEAGEINHSSSLSPCVKTGLQNAFKILETKIDDLCTCQDLIAKHGTQLLKSLANFDSNTDDAADRVKIINERANLLKITTKAMINACGEFVSMGKSQGKKWGRQLQHERQQRTQLQLQLEQLARQHSSLERAAMNDRPTRQCWTAYSDSEEDLFHDAPEDIDVLQDDDEDGIRDHKRTTLSRHASQTSCSAITRDKLFDAEIVTREQESCDEIECPLSPPTPEQSHHCPSTRRRRTSIPSRPKVGLNLWSIMRNCIGKELSKIPMPVNFNEPLSVLQRITEDLEYAHLLHRAADKTNSTEQMCYVAAYSVSAYSTTVDRCTKPFNPLLGETFECDRMDDLGWRSIAEQDFVMTSKFRGAYLSVIPIGFSNVHFSESGNHYSWRKVTTTVHNIIVGKLWVDNHGEVTIKNHKTGDVCHLKLIPYSYFSRDAPRKMTGVVQDKDGVVRWVLQGTWDDHLDILKVVKRCHSTEKSVFETLPARRVWTVNPPYPLRTIVFTVFTHTHSANSSQMYNFTKLAVELNEPEDNVAPTDSRLRPDQRLMEQIDWETANRVKLNLEEKQRQLRRKRQAEVDLALQEGSSMDKFGVQPVWFAKQKDPYTTGLVHMYQGRYWQCKEANDWSACPDNLF